MTETEIDGPPVFDIECMDWVDPVAVGFYDGEDYTEFLKVSEECDVVWEFLSYLGDNHQGIRVYAHNAAHYDNKFILDTLNKHGQTLRFDSGLAKLVWTEKNISFEDSYIMVSKSLAKFCDAFGVERKLDWEHDTTVNIWEMTDRLDSFRAYLKRDCISLCRAIGKFIKVMLDKFNIVPSSTMAITSVKAFNKNFFPVKDINAGEAFEPFIRRATFGGRNEIYRRYGENVYFYDIRDMYVSCYDVPVPIGKFEWIKPNIDEGTIAEAIVKVPDLFIGPLPYRHMGRLIFPTKEFRGWWDTRELRNAGEKFGVDMKIIRQARSEEAPILNEFGDYISDLRYASNKELGLIWKNLGVRLCGKFGQHRYMTEIKHAHAIEDFDGWYPIDTSEVYHERVISFNGRRAPYVKPAINMRIRSEARIRHLDKLIEVKRPFYCDTDSVHTLLKMKKGKNPGEMHLVEWAERAYYIKCKFYGYIDRDGLLRQKTSGFRDFKLSEWDFKKLLEDGEKIEDTTSNLVHWKEVLLEGVKLRAHPRSIESYTGFENRVSVGLDTEPIKLSLPK